MMDNIFKSFQLSTLCVAMLCANSTVFALEELEKLDDYELGESTGEGVALLPQDFSLRFNEAHDTATGANGAGSIRLIPVGPLSTTQESKGYQKADIYIYGLALGQSKKDFGVVRTADDWGEGFGNLGVGAEDFGRTITSWGSADNPWILKTLTNPNVPNFAGTQSSVSHFNIEAPLRHVTIPTNSAETSAYNLKLGLWLDGYMRNRTIAENPLTYDGMTNRFRLNATWDGFGLNGTNMKFFQTLGGATNTGGLNTSYNNTFGLSALIRLNSFDTKVNLTNGVFSGGFGATVTRSTPVKNTVSNPTTIAANATLSANNMVQTYAPLVIGAFEQQQVCGSATSVSVDSGNGSNSGHCLTREAIATRTYTVSGSNSWTAPAILGALRLSTRATTETANTPAISGASAVPNFDKNEGVYLYGLNVNVVLGSLWQPLIFNTPDGNNFSVELTRIPNKEEVYSRIYQAYGSTLKTPNQALSYLGNTCNYYQCGTAVSLNGVSYQGSNATHSSITIGSTLYNATNNTIDAYKGIEALGVSFGPIQSVGTQTLTSTASKDYQQVYRAERGCTTNWLGNCNETFSGWGDWQAVSKTKFNQGDYDRFVLGHTDPNNRGQVLSVTSNVPTTNPLTVPGKSVSNNFGSAAIDGLLIQHFKLTTTGLK